MSGGEVGAGAAASGPVPVRLAQLRSLLEAAGAPPRRRHGQHFLLDDNLLGAIVREAGVGPQSTVLEIGPGPGLLTRHLLARGARVIAVEIDPRVEAVARQLIDGDAQARLEWHCGDALAGTRRFSDLVNEALPRCTHSVSNLPYNVAAPLLAGLLVAERGPAVIAGLVQAEQAARFLAGPGTRDYGPLAVLAGLCSTARAGRRVPPEAFWPRPRVDSVVLQLERRADRPDPESLAALADFLPRAFRSRRKRLFSSLASGPEGVPVGWAERLQAEGQDLQKLQKIRAEALTPVELLALARTWASHAQGERHRP